MDKDEQRIVAQAEQIRARVGETVSQQIRQIENYAFESKHTTKTKLRNLRGALRRTGSPAVKRAIREAIDFLER